MPLKIKLRLLTIVLCIVIVVLCIEAYNAIQEDIYDIGPKAQSPEGDNIVIILSGPSYEPGTGTEPEMTQKPMETQKPVGSKKPVSTKPDRTQIPNEEKPNDLNDIAILVNKTNELPSDFVPLNLVKPDVPFVSGAKNNLMRKEAADALERMFDDARKAGFSLYALSGYRRYDNQKQIFNKNIAKYGSIEAANMYSAKPGQSEHQTGLAMDITSAGVKFKLTEAFGDTPEGKWVAANAHRYGFILRYPKGKEQITGYAYEPWHIRFLGEELAARVYHSGLTYEEYLDKAAGNFND